MFTNKIFVQLIFNKKDLGMVKHDFGFFVYNGNLLEYIVFQFDNRYEIYLLLDDLGNPPYRNILTSGVGRTSEDARTSAIRNLEKVMDKNRY